MSIIPIDVRNVYTLDYKKCTNMSEESYSQMIFDLFNQLSSMPSGNILLHYLAKTKKVVITNYDFYGNRLSDQFRAQVLLNRIIIPSRFKPNLHYVKMDSSVTVYKMIPPLVVVLGHELIHMAHYHLDNNSIDWSDCEENTILGTELLKIPRDEKLFKVCENSIRMELNLPLRINHDSEDLPRNVVYPKENYMMIDLKIYGQKSISESNI